MSFEYILNQLPSNSIRANIIYNLNKLDSEDSKNKYKALIESQYQNQFEDNDYLFFEDLYPELDQIHERISYAKHDRVLRQGVKCKFCKSINTKSADKQKGGGDEYIPTQVQCYDCGKKYLE